MKLNEITINIGVTIPEDTVQRCIQILNMFLTDNPNLTIKIYEENGPDRIYRYMQIEPKEKEE